MVRSIVCAASDSEAIHERPLGIWVRIKGGEVIADHDAPAMTTWSDLNRGHDPSVRSEAGVDSSLIRSHLLLVVMPRV
jgi:hypothetical protein